MDLLNPRNVALKSWVFEGIGVTESMPKETQTMQDKMLGINFLASASRLAVEQGYILGNLLFVCVFEENILFHNPIPPKSFYIIC